MTTRPHTSSPALPPKSAAALQRLLDTELSLPSRLGYVALLLVALTMTAVITALWATEPVAAAARPGRLRLDGRDRICRGSSSRSGP